MLFFFAAQILLAVRRQVRYIQAIFLDARSAAEFLFVLLGLFGFCYCKYNFNIWDSLTTQSADRKCQMYGRNGEYEQT